MINKVFGYLGLVINIAILLFGSVLLFTKYFEYIPIELKRICGIILLAYSLIRIISIVGKLKEDNAEDHEGS